MPPADVGSGGHVEALNVAGLWSEKECFWHISQLELKAGLSSCPIRQSCQAVHRQYGDCLLCRQTWRSLLFLPVSERRGDALLFSPTGLPFRIPGKLNIVANALSQARSVLHAEWTLRCSLQCGICGLPPWWTFWLLTSTTGSPSMCLQFWTLQHG